ncbi:MAG: GntR family transcriptional regulator [Treponema sp.]|jgi:DNA-binding FadR family transcriptional regulator|nr:GntR family transcriptional regulator [Treponema sp.]
MEFTELVSPTLTDLFVKKMEHNILSGKLAIGERLPNERELALKMKVSRGVINGGIAKLVHLGFLKVVPRKGTFVEDYRRYGKLETLQTIIEYNGGHYSPQMIDSLFEIRNCLERNLAELAAKNRTEQDIAALWEKIETLRGIEDPAGFGLELFDFFHLLAKASKNIIYPLLLQGFESLYPPLSEAIMRKSMRAGKKNARLMMLTQLVDYIAQKNHKAAAANITESIHWGRAVLERDYAAGSVYREEQE